MNAAIADLPLGPLVKGVIADTVTVDGTLSARASGRVPLADPRRGDGVLTIDPLRLTVAGETLNSARPVEVRWSQAGLQLARLELAGRQGTVSGSGTIGADRALDVHARASIPLAALAAIRPEIREASGDVEVSVRATGTLDAPLFSGDGTIKNANLLLRDRPETVRGLEARFALSRQGVQVTEASATVGGGRVQARGDLGLDGWRPGTYRMTVTAKNVAIATVEGLSSAWDADLDLSGIGNDARLEGQARLVRGVYSRDLSLLSLALSSRREAAAAPAGLGLRLRVRVRLDDNLVVRNRTADLRAGGTLSVEGTSARPIVFGAIESRDGRITFRSHDWNVTIAAVRFADPRRIDPILDVSATSHIRDYDVTIQITGRVSDLSVRLTSSPPLAQDDLLALVSFGATRAELSDSPGSFLIGEAGKALVQNVLGIDPSSATGLHVSTVGSSAGSAEQTKHGPWDERPPAGTSRSTPGDRKEKVRVEYQMFNPLYLSGEYDLDGGYGADIVLRFRFR